MSKDNQLVDSFVGKTQHFYVLRREGLANPAIPKKYAVYATVDTYNTRSEPPSYIEADIALADFSHPLSIYPESLTTTPPVYPADRDETDYGLTNTRSLWLNRFQRAKEGQAHVA